MIIGPIIEEQIGKLGNISGQIRNLQMQNTQQVQLLEKILNSLQRATHLSQEHSTFRRGSRWATAQSKSVMPIGEQKKNLNSLESYFECNEEGRGIWKWRHYFEAYHRHLKKFVTEDRNINMAEVGVYSGGSLEMWRSYFGEKLTIHGIDIEEACKSYESKNVYIHIGDQENREFWEKFREQVPELDIFVDDGGHTPEQQMVTLEEMLPHIKPGGVYICEDIHDLGNEFFLFVMGIVDQLNHYQYTNEKVIASTTTPFQACYHSAHFYPYMVVIEKLLVCRDRLISEKKGSHWQPFFNKQPIE